jgi:EAL domain-containing protein (putative c-di-GMP-specific phosphodiesterase class I)
MHGFPEARYSDPDRLDDDDWTDETIVYFPVRATGDASLRGFEVRSCGPLMRADLVARAPEARRKCPTLGACQLDRALSSRIAELMTEHSTKLGEPVSWRTLLDAKAKASLARVLEEANWAPGSLTLAISPDEPDMRPECLDVGLALLASFGMRVAISDVSAVSHVAMTETVFADLVDEVRVSCACTQGEVAEGLFAMVARLRRQGVPVTGLDVSTVEQCQAAIEAQLEYVQGDLIGRAHGFARLKKMLQERAWQAKGRE